MILVDSVDDARKRRHEETQDGAYHPVAISRQGDPIPAVNVGMLLYLDWTAQVKTQIRQLVRLIVGFLFGKRELGASTVGMADTRGGSFFDGVRTVG